MVGRLIFGLLGLFLLTIMSGLFGIGGFLFTIGFFAVVVWAVSARG